MSNSFTTFNRDPGGGEFFHLCSQGEVDSSTFQRASFDGSPYIYFAIEK